MSATLATLGLRRFRPPRDGGVWTAVLTVTISWGCLTTVQGRQVRTDLADVRARLDDIDKLDRDHKEEVVELQRVVDQATVLLTAHTNDVGPRKRERRPLFRCCRSR